MGQLSGLVNDNLSTISQRSPALFFEVYDLEELFYTRCAVENSSWLADGICSDFPPYNSSGCGFDKGDCVGNPECIADEYFYAVKRENVALGKPTEQSSIHLYDYYDFEPYLNVSLGDKYFISRIIIV